MATVTYSFVTISAQHRLDNSPNDVNGLQDSVSVASSIDGHWIATWNTQTDSELQGISRDMNDTTGTTIKPNSSTFFGNQYDSASAGLTDGRILTVFTDDSSGHSVIRASFVNPMTGTVSAGDFVVGAYLGYGGEVNASVAGLGDGGYVVAFEDIFTSTDHDIEYQVYNSNSTARSVLNFVTSSSDDERDAHVAGLHDGGFIVTWTDNVPGTGGFLPYSQIKWTRYDAQGVQKSTGTVAAGSPGDTQDQSVVASLASGGWAVAYRDSTEAGGSGLDITLAIYDASNNLVKKVLVNQGATTGYQYTPTITVLPNDTIMVGWSTPGGAPNLPNSSISVFDSNGNVLLSGSSPFGAGYDNLQLAALGVTDGSRFVAAADNIFNNALTGPDVAGGVFDFVRTTTGGASREVFVGDGTDEVVNMGGGNDTYFSTTGFSVVNGGGGLDQVIRTVDSHTATITHNVDGSVTIAGAGYSQSLTSVEFAQFSDKAVALREPTRADFDGNGGSDMLWQNSDGSIVLWTMNGTSITGGGNVLNPGNSWKAVGTGDFNSDGNSDIILQNTNGSIVEWQMNGNSVIGGGVLGVNPGSQWRLVGSGDFNGDGFGDMLLQNTSGAIVDWYMNGTGIIGGGQLAINPGSSWKLVCSGNFNGDGTSDMLFQNTDGSIVEWNVNGSNIIGGGPVINPGAAWKVVNSGDFNGDGKSDLVLQNTDGSIVDWFMNGSNIIGGSQLAVNPGSSWHVMGTRDYNNDGFSDLLLQNDNGAVTEWFMNGTNIIGGGQVTTNPGSSWKANGN